MNAGRPALYNTPEELEKAVKEYFFIYPEVNTKCGTVIKTSCEPTFRINVTIAGLAYHLGFESRQSFYDYEEKPEFSYIIKRARLLVEMSYEERLAGNNATGAIFALKNMGWKDKTEVEQSGELAINWNVQKTYEAKPETDGGG